MARNLSNRAGLHQQVWGHVLARGEDCRSAGDCAKPGGDCDVRLLRRMLGAFFFQALSPSLFREVMKLASENASTEATCRVKKQCWASIVGNSAHIRGMSYYLPGAWESGRDDVFGC